MRLYHGTTPEYARLLLEQGFIPGTVSSGANGGQGRYLYLTSVEENALWFAEQKGEGVVLAIEDVREEELLVDPEDGVGESVAEELATSKRNGLPANFVLKQVVEASRFKLVRGKI